MIGSFGQIIFEVSASSIMTFKDFKRKRSAVFAEHKVIKGKPVLQHTGASLDEVGFSVILDSSLGINPLKSLSLFIEQLESGRPRKLIINKKAIGLFVITDLEEEWQRIDNKGRILSINLNLSLREFASGV